MSTFDWSMNSSVCRSSASDNEFAPSLILHAQAKAFDPLARREVFSTVLECSIISVRTQRARHEDSKGSAERALQSARLDPFI